MSFNTASGKYCCNSNKALEYIEEKYYSFNTASGKYCCNQPNVAGKELEVDLVSIPQAVSTVATLLHHNPPRKGDS